MSVQDCPICGDVGGFHHPEKDVTMHNNAPLPPHLSHLVRPTASALRAARPRGKPSDEEIARRRGREGRFPVPVLRRRDRVGVAALHLSRVVADMSTCACVIVNGFVFSSGCEEHGDGSGPPDMPAFFGALACAEALAAGDPDWMNCWPPSLPANPAVGSNE